MLTGLQYALLRRFFPPPAVGESTAYLRASKLTTLLGEQFLERIKGQVVVDFGCGEGAESVAMAHAGAAHVIGVDIRDDVIATAKARAQSAGVADRCEFTTVTTRRCDVIVSLDAFEHFSDPAQILNIMDSLLRDDGEILISFGPTWFHPRGGHLFSVFPWAHLIFSEDALLRWRADFKSDGATRFSEVAGGLNQMTIARFESVVAQSPFRFADVEHVPIRPLRQLHNHRTREWTTAIVRCRLVKRSAPSANNLQAHSATLPMPSGTQ